MMENVFLLPFEIQEKILSYLDVSDLLAAVEAYQQWNFIAEHRLLKCLCLKNLSSDFIAEITHGKFCNQAEHTSSFNWKSMLKKWNLKVYQGVFDAFRETESEFSTVRPLPTLTLSSTCCCLAVSGNFIIIGDAHNNLVWFNSNGKRVFIKSNFGEQVASIGLLNIFFQDSIRTDDDGQCLEHDAVIVTSRNFFAVYSMHPWNCQDLFYQNEKRRDACKVAVQGSQFVHYNDDCWMLTIYDVIPSKRMVHNMVTGEPKHVNDVSLWDVSVEIMSSFKTPCRAWDWKLWKKCLVALLQDGSVITWDIDKNVCLCKSNTVSDLLYPFDSFMYRGLIFVNVSAAQAMLNYWHVDTGPPYWLLSSDGIMFTRMKSMLLGRNEITAVCVRRTVVAFGTNQGRVYLYRHILGDGLFDLIFKDAPSTVLFVTNGPIYYCDFSFMKNYLLVCVKTVSQTVVLFRIPTV